jgi:serine/threonine protein kinase/tetratricopeptide (TPR) repeat protein
MESGPMSVDLPDDDKTETHIAVAAGTIVSQYKIIEKIGAGGMGEVYLAEDTELKRKVALKFLSRHLCRDEDCRARFKREAQAAAALKHAGIITIYEVSEFNGRPFMAMEYIEGKSLRNRIKENRLTINESINLTIQICAGLNEAHESGIIHRDIKPSNILLDKNNQPIILDFGLATVKGTDKITKTGSTLGTLGYMSPEQIEGKETDARSDLFSLGVVLYELIANKSPFRRDDETATLKAILQDTPEPLARYKSGVPDDLQRIVSKLLEKDSSLRYQSAAGVIPDLKRLSSASTVGAGAAKRLSRWSRYMVSSAVIALLAVLSIWYFGFRNRVPTPSSEDNRIMLAVLPFENLGDPEDEYFADGMTEEIISRFASISNVGVISRTSVYAYKDSRKSLPEIADDLGVEYILEGTIRWDRSSDISRIRVTPQLIEVATDMHLWSERYDRSFTSVFDVQSDIAAKVVEALGASLQGTDPRLLARVKTDNMEAYNAYLKAKELYYMPDVNRARVVQMIGLLGRAIQLDSSFASAHAMLSMAHGHFWHIGLDHTSKRLDLALDAARAALEVDPSLPDGHMAMAWYHYRAERDYDAAFNELKAAGDLGAAQYDLDRLAATLYKRQGDFEKAVKYNERALKSNPRDPDVLQETALCYKWMGQTQQALNLSMKTIEVAPDQHSSYEYTAMYLYSVTGGLEKARAILEKIPGELTERDHMAWVYQEFYERDTTAILKRLRSPKWSSVSNQGEVIPKKLLIAWVYRYLGDPSDAEQYFIQAAEELSADRQQRPDDERLLVPLAYVYAGLNQPEKAMAYSDSASQSLLAEKDLIAGTFILKHRVCISAAAGSYDAAIETLDRILGGPSPWSIHDYLIDPLIDPLRDHPQFQALIKKYDKEYGT